MNFDRTGLPYLNGLEKLNCAYCSYVNGVIAYVREVGSRTEQYWCPIKHTRRVIGAHGRYDGFEDFGDGEGYRRHLDTLRSALRTEADGDPSADPSPRNNKFRPSRRKPGPGAFVSQQGWDSHGAYPAPPVTHRTGSRLSPG